MDSHDGIQKLLAAEQEAQAIVTAARASTNRVVFRVMMIGTSFFFLH
jgi:hypothetical protein